MSASSTLHRDPSAPGEEQSALLEAYAAKRADLVRFFTARTGSAADAEDLVQDLYLKLMAMGPSPVIENPSAMLYRITINLMLDRARGERRSRARDDAWRDAHRIQVGGVDIADELSPEQSAEAREGLRQLMRAVTALPPKTRQAFALHKLEGLSQADTAARLGVSRKTVEKQISAALKSLVANLKRVN